MRVKWNEKGRGTRNNHWLHGLFQHLYARLCGHFVELAPVAVCGLRTQVSPPQPK